MNEFSHLNSQQLRNNLEKLLHTLKVNREKVPIHILKTKYKSGYNTLCQNIAQTATLYLKQIILNDIRIHKDYLDEVVSLINVTIEKSGLLKKLTEAAFEKQDIMEFTNLSLELQKQILFVLSKYYEKHTGSYIHREDSGTTSEIYCYVNDCIWKNNRWIPFESAIYQSLQNSA